MILFNLLLAIVSLYQAKLVHYSKGQFEASFERERTDSVKGFFILVVFLSHFSSYVSYTAFLDKLWFRFFSLIGQRMVTLFLLYSGYGVAESIKSKGYPYVKMMPVKRILKVLFRFDCAVLVFIVADYIMDTLKSYSASEIVLSFVGWESVGNSNWYIFAILSAYLITYFSFCIVYLLLKKEDRTTGLILTSAGAILYIGVLYGFKMKASYWYDTILCYPLGMTFSLYKEKIGAFFTKRHTYMICFIGLLCIEVLSLKYYNFILNIVAMMAFAVLMILITMKIKIQNPILVFFGKHLFSIYILQRLPMMILQKIGVPNIYLSFIICFIITVLLAVIFDAVVSEDFWRNRNQVINKRKQ